MRIVLFTIFALTTAGHFMRHDPAEAAVRSAVVGTFLLAAYFVGRWVLLLARKIGRRS